MAHCLAAPPATQVCGGHSKGLVRIGSVGSSRLMQPEMLDGIFKILAVWLLLKTLHSNVLV